MISMSNVPVYKVEIPYTIHIIYTLYNLQGINCIFKSASSFLPSEHNVKITLSLPLNSTREGIMSAQTYLTHACRVASRVVFAALLGDPPGRAGLVAALWVTVFNAVGCV